MMHAELSCGVSAKRTPSEGKDMRHHAAFACLSAEQDTPTPTGQEAPENPNQADSSHVP